MHQTANTCCNSNFVFVAQKVNRKNLHFEREMNSYEIISRRPKVAAAEITFKCQLMAIKKCTLTFQIIVTQRLRFSAGGFVLICDRLACVISFGPNSPNKIIMTREGGLHSTEVTFVLQALSAWVQITAPEFCLMLSC